MATIPDAQTLGARNPSPTRQIATYDGSAGARGMIAAGRELQQFGAKAEIELEKKRKEESAFQKAQMALKVKAGVTERLNYYQENPQKYPEFEKDFANTFKGLAKEGLAIITSEKDRKLAGVALDEMFIDYNQTVRSLGRGYAKQGTIGEIDAHATRIENVAMNARSKDEYLADKMALSQRIQNDPNLDPLERISLNKKYIDGIDDKFYANETVRNPAGVYKQFSAPSAGAVPDFKADTVKPYDGKRIESIRQMVEAPSQYDSLFVEMGEKYGVDPKELKLRAAVESGLNPTAQAKATPYGQSGGLMQLEAQTAKNLGVTDRNDPRQSVEGAAKLLAKHQEAANGDQSMVDKLYYAGSPKLMGKNTEQYTANLAAVRGNIKSGNVSPDIAQKYREQARSMVAVNVRQGMQEFDAASEMNIIVPKPKIDELATQAQELGLTREYEKIMQFSRDQDLLTDFVLVSLREMPAKINEVRKEAETGDAQAVRKLAIYTVAAQKKQKGLKENPRAYYEANGLMKPVESDIFSGGAYEAERRRNEIESVRELDGVRVPIITDGEAESLKALYDEGNTSEIVKAFDSLQIATQPSERALVAKKISEKDKSLGVAMASDRNTALMIINGAKTESNVGEQKFRNMASKYLVGASAVPGDMDPYYSAAYNYYKSAAFNNKDVSSEPNSSKVKEAVQAVAGNVRDISLNGTVSRIIVPPGMEPSEVQDILYNISDEYLVRLGGALDSAGRTLTASRFFAGNKFVTIGRGKYMAVNSSTNEYVLNKAGQPLVFDITQIPDAGAKTPKPSVLYGM